MFGGRKHWTAYFRRKDRGCLEKRFVKSSRKAASDTRSSRGLGSTEKKEAASPSARLRGSARKLLSLKLLRGTCIGATETSQEEPRLETTANLQIHVHTYMNEPGPLTSNRSTRRLWRCCPASAAEMPYRSPAAVSGHSLDHTRVLQQGRTPIT